MVVRAVRREPLEITRGTTHIAQLMGEPQITHNQLMRGARLKATLLARLLPMVVQAGLREAAVMWLTAAQQH